MAPFPPPQAVLEYEKALPGSWDRMLTMAEEAQAADIRNVQGKGEYLRRAFMRGRDSLGASGRRRGFSAR